MNDSEPNSKNEPVFRALTPEQSAELEPLTAEEIRQLLAEGYAARLAAERFNKVYPHF